MIKYILMKTKYESPEVKIDEMVSEGVLCNSLMEGVGEEQGNGEFV